MELIERDSFLYSWLLKSKFVYKLLDDMLPSNKMNYKNNLEYFYK